MIVRKIFTTKKFDKELKKMSPDLLGLAEKKVRLFRENPLHSSLRLHELHGNLKESWAIYINIKYRIIFVRDSNGDILFISIGKHDVYRSL
jgi:addiction module RelE/StbE family toxin